MEPGVLIDKDVIPTEAVLRPILGKSFALWEAFLESIHAGHPDMREEWRFYNDGKRWLMKVTRKANTVCWVSVIKGGFLATFYFTDRAKEAILGSSISDELKEQFTSGKKYNKIRGVTVTFAKKKDVVYAQELVGLKLAVK